MQKAMKDNGAGKELKNVGPNEIIQDFDKNYELLMLLIEMSILENRLLKVIGF